MEGFTGPGRSGSAKRAAGALMAERESERPDPHDPAVILYWALKASGQWDATDEPWTERFEKDFRETRDVEENES